ncbi:MAG: serine protease [Gammaproteobacteria bacterium]|nr:serine protease [Gammaproteobacteria bacterium]
MTVNIKTYVRPLGVQRQRRQISFAGTAFGVERPGLVVTAAHVVQDATPDRLHLEIARTTTTCNAQFRSPRSLVVHPSADVALLTFDEDDAIPYFELAKPPDDIGGFHLGTEILSYGYPRRIQSPGRVALEPRLLTGHIQRAFRHQRAGRSYSAYELSFPSVDGQSGSPVLLANDVTSAVAMATDNFESSIVVDQVEEHDAQDRLERHITKKVIAYGVALALWPLADWIRSA